MQDIDFDELDRAVNSVISPSTPVASRGDSIPVAPRTTTPSPAARRSSGRFMDVVHPSSDMRPQPNADSTPQPTQEEPVTPRSAESFQWPDPIELSGTHSEDSSAGQTPTEEEPSVQPLDSPFLPDAKVEKRPLGSPTTSGPVVTQASETPQAEASTEADEAAMPAELHDAVVTVESKEMPVEASESAASLSPASTPVVEALSGPSSITQQYKEQPSTADQPSGPIYDTEAYHQPLSHPEKKHSSILVVVWILALILVGGGMGAAVYFFVLPML